MAGSGHEMVGMTAADTGPLKIASILIGLYFIIELAIALYTGSIAVLSDAFHTFTAVGGIVLAFVAGKIAEKPAGPYKSFGWKRVEIIGALLNGFLLLIMAIVAIWMGYNRLQHPIHLPTGYMFLAAVGGIITEVIALKLLYSGQKTRLNIRGAFWHILQTFVGSINIIIAALVLQFTGFLAIDPILGMLFGLVLIYAAFTIIRDSINILIESVPPDIDLRDVKQALLAIPGITDVHHIHAWALTSGVNIFSSHVRVRDITKSEDVLVKARKLLEERFKFYFTTLQIETECVDSGKARDIDVERI